MGQILAAPGFLSLVFRWKRVFICVFLLSLHIRDSCIRLIMRFMHQRSMIWAHTASLQQKYKLSKRLSLRAKYHLSSSLCMKPCCRMFWVNSGCAFWIWRCTASLLQHSGLVFDVKGLVQSHLFYADCNFWHIWFIYFGPTFSDVVIYFSPYILFIYLLWPALDGM